MAEQRQRSTLHTRVEQEHQATNGTAMLRIAQLVERLSLEQQLQHTPQPDLQQEHLITIASLLYRDLHVALPLQTQQP